MNLAIVIIITSFPVCGLIFYYIKTKNDERIKLIEKGINPDEGLNITEFRKQTNLKNGVILTSLATGLFIAHLLVLNFEQLDRFITYVSMLLLFGGIGFILTFFILKNLKTK